MDYFDLQSCSRPSTSEPSTPELMTSETGEYATPSSISSAGLESTAAAAMIRPTFVIPEDLTQAIVDADPQLKRIQQDLLVLTSFNENETLHWRPSWFTQGHFAEKFWTLHNPPNVVTESLPREHRGRQFFTRRVRDAKDIPSVYIKNWEHWRRCCDLYGVPYDFLCEEQIELMRLGLPRDGRGYLQAPPTHPLYPEPQPLGTGRYILAPSTYTTHLPKKFHAVDHAAAVTDQVEVVVVHSNGALEVEARDKFFMHSSQWTHFDGQGGYELDQPQIVDLAAPKEQGAGRRWSYLPWTREQEESCRPMKIFLRSPKKTTIEDVKEVGRVEEMEGI